MYQLLGLLIIGWKVDGANDFVTGTLVRRYHADTFTNQAGKLVSARHTELVVNGGIVKQETRTILGHSLEYLARLR